MVTSSARAVIPLAVVATGPARDPGAGLHRPAEISWYAPGKPLAEGSSLDVERRR